MRKAALVALAAFGVAASGCTARYSQSLAGAMPRTQGALVSSSDSGFSLLNITLDEPRPAHEQAVSLLSDCSSLSSVEVDYRELSFVVFGFPKVRVTGRCVP